MPSPFPGMDPFLEETDLFLDLQFGFIVHLSEAIMAELPMPYYAIIRWRTWFEEDERCERFIEVRCKENNDNRLVATIEMLTPTNKNYVDKSHEIYLRGQREMLKSAAHLVELDFLRGGRHTTAIPEHKVVAETGGFDYHVCCHRFDRPQDYFVYPIRLKDSLPVIAIPLLPGDQDVTMPLQPLFDRVYDAGAFPRVVDYRDPVPEPPLGPAKAKWVKKRLAQAGLLKRK